MTRTSRSLFLLIVLALAAGISSAQVQIGTPPFGSFGGGPDVINLANLNMHLTIPVIHKPGRGTNFNYDLTFDSSVWYPVGASGHQSWQPVPNWGWASNSAFASGNTGYQTYDYSYSYCYDGQGHPDGEYQWYGNSIYHDAWGTTHHFFSTLQIWGGGCGNSNINSYPGLAIDGSGLTLNGPGLSVVTAVGAILNPPANPLRGAYASTVTDRNGNEMNADTSGHFYDTLSSTIPVLTVAGSGPITFTYTAPSGANASYTMKYTNYTLATNFGVSGISEYRSAAAVGLVSGIVLPDGSQYSFAYEPTPGTCAPYAGTTCVTARVKSIILPTGGTITYAYSGGNNGILPDGSTATLTRATPDTASNSWVYAQVKGTGAASTTTVTDPERDTLAPNGNDTVIQFQGTYEAQRQVYQGTHTAGALLETTNTCYNASTSPCTGTAIALPITQRSVAPQFPSGQQAIYIYNYNSFGLLTNEYDHDYGPAGSTPLNREIDVAFAALSNNINAFKQTVTVKDGSGNIKAQTTYNYDETAVATPTNLPTPQHVSVSGSRGNLTSINYPVSGLTAHYTNFDTGNVKTATDVNGAVTTYTYSALSTTCGNAFPDGVAEPVGSMSQSFTWNCTGGAMTQLTDENSKNVSASYTDTEFWRPASITDQVSAATSITYTGQTAVEATLNFNSGNSTSDQLITADGLGRAHVQQIRQSPSLTTFDSVENDFDALGRSNRTTLPYSATASQTNSSAPAVATTYDALSRVLSTMDAGTGKTTYTYNQNDMLVAVGPAPGTENPKQRQLEYDSLGSLTSVCEITSTLPGNGSCAQTNAKTGYWTKYSHDALGNLLTVTQNAQASSGSQQTRTYAFDAMSRLTSETNPENGVTSYIYDTISSGACAGTSYGDLLKRVDAIGNVTCYTYDLLHRTLSQTYAVTSPTISTPGKYFVYDSATVSSTSMQYAKTRLAEAYTCVSPCTTKITDLGQSYSARGELTDTYEMTPHSGGTGAPYNHTSTVFWPSGALSHLTGPGLPTLTYSPDGEGRSSTVSDGSGHGPVTSTVYNLYTTPPQLKVTLGSGDSDVFSFDANTFRLNKYQFNVGSQSVVGTLGWNANWSLGSLGITDPFTPANTQNCSYTADDVARISQVSCGTVWGQNFAYDPFGNIQKKAIPGDGGTSFAPCYQSSPSITNRISLVGGTGSTCTGGTAPTYDANGNSLNDTFHAFTWDAENRPVTIGSVTLTYDALGRMVEQSVSSTNSEVVYSPLGAKLALMNGSTLTKAFAPLPGGATAVYTSSGQASYYRHTDHLGSSRFASTSSQTLYSDTAYSPFGETYASSGSIDASFTGQNQDTTAGLYDFPYREYDPNQSRWTSPDPAGPAAVDPTNPQSWSRYSYVLNNPLAFVDLTGLVCVDSSGNIIVDQDGNEIYEDQDACNSYSGGGTWVDPAPGESVTVSANGPDDNGILDGIGGAGGGFGFGRGNNAPKTPWYKTCTAKAIGSGLLHVGVDAIGLIPEGGLVSRAVGNLAGYRGIVATQQGTKALQAGKLGTGIGSAGGFSNDASTTGLVSTGLGVAGIAATLASATPVVAQAIAVASIGVDIFSSGKEIANCR